MVQRTCGALILVLAFLGCAPPVSTPADQGRHQAAQMGDGPLQVFTTGLMTDGRTAKIRGRVKNISDQRVEGIRFEVVLIEASSSRVLDTMHDEVDTTLDPQQEAPLRLNVQSMYFGSEPHFFVRAVPVKLTNVQ